MKKFSFHYSLFLGFSLSIGSAIYAKIEFNQEVRPILAKHCLSCHGPDEESRKAKLRLDTYEGATKEQDGIQALVPGKPDESELIYRVEADDPDEIMPPPEDGPALTFEEKKILRQWIQEGGNYLRHWSFQIPTKSEKPGVKAKNWPKHSIDYFVLAQLERAQLAPAKEANRYEWIRRVSLDLTGLPPTPEEANAFVADKSAKAHEKVIDRLLSDEAYGEHWARMWLDLARYADTKGYEKDRHRNIWPYRNWVIQALNKDMPFDQFTKEQLAGDLLPEPKQDQLIATAFHRNTMTNDEGGTDNEEFRVAAVKDRVDTTIQVWMGLTMGCAKCHSHKYDPITRDDYYSFYALFNQTEDADRPDDFPTLPLPTSEQIQKETALQKELDDLKLKLKATQEEKPKKDLEKQISDKNKALSNHKKSYTKVPILKELQDNKRRVTRDHIRGNFLDQGKELTPKVLDNFGALPTDQPLSRLGVAHWLMQPENPLTARVMVNRIWARIFGIGIVETEEDFGTQGTLPTHPELLDWLAVDFRENNWSLKQLLRTITLSATYRQAANTTPEKLFADPNNRLFSRGPRFRLSAEAVRDQALAVSGLLSQKLGGPSVMPPQPDGIWKSTYNAGKWTNATGPDRFRRGLYTYWKRTSPYPAMITFDAGSGEVCQIRRIRTNTPLQALVTLNDEAYIEAAGGLAKRMHKIKGTPAEKVEHGFRLVLTRPPSCEELSRLVQFYETMQADYKQDPDATKALLTSAKDPEGDPAMISIANVLLNLDETLTKP